jgi:hypothetical protein
MNQSSLQVFADRVLAKGRMGKRDVQDLQRNCLADGVTSRGEAEILIRLDRQAGSVHASWSAYFIAALTDFVVWGSRPTGTIDADTASWLAAALNCDGGSPRARRLVTELMSEAQSVDDALLAIVDGAAVTSRCSPCETALAA